MPIGLRATPTRSPYTTSTSVDFTRPAGLQAGDFIELAFYAGSTSVVPTPPTGFQLKGTKLVFSGGSSGNYRGWKFFKVADGTEPATISFALDQNTDHSGEIWAHWGVDTANPYDVAGTSATGNTASIDLPGLTTVTPGAVISWMAQHWNGANGTESASPGFTMQFIEAGRGNILQDRTMTSPAATGTVSVATTTTPWVGWMDALRPSKANVVTRSGTQLLVNGAPTRFSGANIYWLGLTDNQTPNSGKFPTRAQIDTALQLVDDSGGNMVRAHTISMSAGTPLSFEPTAGNFVHANLDAADWAVYRAGELGISLVVPLVDEHNYYHGGKGVFVQWAYQENPSGGTPLPYPGNLFNASQNGKDSVEERQFFNNDAFGLRVRAKFTDYVTNWLNHVNPYTGLAYKDDPTIAIIETGNELYDSTAEWQDYCAQLVKSIAPNKLVADGSSATGLTVANAKGLNSSYIDIVGSHYYVRSSDYSQPIGYTTTPSQYGTSTSALQQLAADVSSAQTAGKVFLIGEYPWTRGDVSAFYTAIEGNTNIAADLFWSVTEDAFTHGDSQPGGDDYSLHRYNATAFEQQAAPRLTQHIVAMTKWLALNDEARVVNLLPDLAQHGTDASIYTGGGYASITVDSTRYEEGATSLRVNPPSTADYPYFRADALYAQVFGGQQYSASVAVLASFTGVGFHTRIIWRDANGADISTSDGPYTVPTLNVWTPITVTAMAPANAVRAVIQFQTDNSVTSSSPYNVDFFSLVYGATPQPLFGWAMGDTIEYWDGSAIQIGRLSYWDGTNEWPIQSYALA